MTKIKTTSEVPSAGDFYESIDENYEMLSDIPHIHRTMIEFAKLHVKAALEAVIDKMDDTLAVDDYQEVRNTYPETNIK